MAWVLNLGDIERFLLVFFRVGGIFIFAPFFASFNIPARVKISFSFAISLLLFLTLRPKMGWRRDVPFLYLALEALYEMGVGVAIAFVMSLIFTGIKVSGQLIGLKMGFGIANIIAPSSNTQLPIIANLQYLLALMLFLSINGHHLLLLSLSSSFDLIPLYGAKYDTPLLNYIIGLFGDVFVVALKISGPVIITILLTDIALGMLARVMPQMNIFMLGFPLKIAVGLLTLAASIQVFGYFFINQLYKLKGEIFILLRLFKP